MRPLLDILTDYVSKNVFVEEIIDALNKCVNTLNASKSTIAKFFHHEDLTNDDYKFVLIFKGGNIYRIAYTIMKENMSVYINVEILNKMMNYLKRSDCDFGLFIIRTNKITKTTNFLHPNRDLYENIIKKATYFILNEFRNEMLRTSNSLRLLGLCRNNDVVMKLKTKELSATIEQNILKGINVFKKNILINLLIVLDITDPISYFNFKNDSIDELDSELIYIFNHYSNLENYYKLCLLMLEEQKINVHINGEVSTQELHIVCIKVLSSMKADLFNGFTYGDIMMLWDFDKITGMVLSDNYFGIDDTSETTIIQSLLQQKNNDFRDNKLKRDAKRCVSKRNNKYILTSNRFDFIIDINFVPVEEKEEDEKENKKEDEKDEEQIDDVIGHNFINATRIAFDDSNSIGTPFYISFNKTIIARYQFNKLHILERLEQNIKRYKTYGSGNVLIGENKKYDKLVDNFVMICDNIRANADKSFTKVDISLGRLMINFQFIYKKKNQSFGVIGLNSGLIDISTSYEADFKAHFFEIYEYYIQMVNPRSKIVNGQNKIDKEYIELIARMINNNDFVSANIAQQKYDGMKNVIVPINFNNILVPNIQVYIIDLYLILFMDSEKPWFDIKYTKRLWRFTFFVFMDILMTLKKQHILNLFKFMGYDEISPIIFNKGIKPDSLNNFVNFIEYIKTIEQHYHPNLPSHIGQLDQFMYNFHLTDYIERIKNPRLQNKQNKQYEFNDAVSEFNDIFFRAYYFIDFNDQNKTIYLKIQYDHKDINNVINLLKTTNSATMQKWNLENDKIEIVRGHEEAYLRQISTMRIIFAQSVYNMFIYNTSVESTVYPAQLTASFSLMHVGEINEHIGINDAM